jgi:hypothetical protein
MASSGERMEKQGDVNHQISTYNEDIMGTNNMIQYGLLGFEPSNTWKSNETHC